MQVGESVAMNRAIHQSHDTLVELGIQTVAIWDGPHMDLYWITSASQMEILLRRVGRDIIRQARQNPHYCCLIESKFWFDLLMSSNDPADEESLGRQLRTLVADGQVVVAPHVALLDPWRPIESLLIQNTVKALNDYHRLGITPVNAYYAADLFGISPIVQRIVAQLGQTLIHTKGADDRLAAYPIGLWRLFDGDDAALTWNLKGGYASGVDLGKLPHQSGVDGFRHDRYLVDTEAAMIKAANDIRQVAERFGARYVAAGLTTLGIPVGVDYSNPNRAVAEVVPSLANRLADVGLTVKGPQEVLDHIDRGVTEGSIRTIDVRGLLDHTFEENLVAGVHLSRMWVQLRAWKMQRALWRAQAAATLAWLADAAEYPFDQLDDLRTLVMVDFTHDQTCWVDPDIELEQYARFVKVVKACRRIEAESWGFLAKADDPEANQLRNNYFRYRNQDGRYSVGGNYGLWPRSGMVAIPLTDGVRAQPTITNQLFWHQRRGGQLAVMVDDALTPAQVVKRWVRHGDAKRYLRSYAAAWVKVEPWAATDIRLIASDVSFTCPTATDCSITNGRLMVEAKLEDRVIRLTDGQQQRHWDFWLVDSGNGGDLYNAELVGRIFDSRRQRLGNFKSRLISHGPVFSEMEVVQDIELPVGLAVDERGAFPKRRRRHQRQISNHVVWRIKLYQAEPARVDVEVEVTNRSRDHLLELAISAQLDVEARVRWQPVVMRQPLDPPARATDVVEPKLHQYDGRMVAAGSLLLLKPTINYRVLREEDGGAALAVPLISSVGILSRPDLRARQGAAGGEMATPDAQGEGVRLTMPLQLWTDADQQDDTTIWQRSEDFFAGEFCLTAPEAGRALEGLLPTVGCVGNLGVKRSEQGDGAILWVNNPDINRGATLKALRPVELTGLDEQQREGTTRYSGETIEIKPGGQQTILVPKS